MCARIAFKCSRIAFTCVHYSEYMRTYSPIRSHALTFTCARINVYVRMFYVLRAHLLLFHWSIYHMRTYCFRVRTYCFHMRTYWFHVRMYILENTCAFIHTCVRTYSLLHAHVKKYVKRAHVFENNAHVSSMPPWNGLNLTIKQYESISCTVFKPIILHTVTTHS